MIVIDLATAGWIALALLVGLGIYATIADRKQASMPAGLFQIPAVPETNATASTTSVEAHELVRRLAARTVGQALVMWASPHLHFTGAVLYRKDLESGRSYDAHMIYEIRPNANMAGLYIGRFDELASLFGALVAEDMLFSSFDPPELATRIHIPALKQLLLDLLGQGKPGSRPTLPRWWSVPALQLLPSALPLEVFGEGNVRRHGPWLAHSAGCQARSLIFRYQSRMIEMVDHLLEHESLDASVIERICGDRRAASRRTPSAS